MKEDHAPFAPDGNRGLAGTAFEPVWLLVTVLAIIYACAFIDRNLFSLLVEPIERSLGIDDLKMSFVLGLGFSIFIAVVNIPAGVASDRYGRRGLIGAAAVTWSVMTVLSGLSEGFVQLLLCRMGVGLSEAFLTPSTFSLIRDRVDPRLRGRAFSVIGLSPSLGAAMSFIIGGMLVGASARGDFSGWPVLGGLRDWQVALVVVGVAGIVPAALLWMLRPDTHRRPYPGENMRMQLAAAWRHMVGEAASYALLIAYATAGGMIAAGYVNWFPAVMGRNFRMPVAQIGQESGPILLVASILGLLACGFALDWLAARGRSLASYGLFAMAMVTLAGAMTPFAASASQAFALLAVAAFFLSNFYPVGAALLARWTPSRLMGSTTAIYLLFLNLGMGLGPTAVSLLARAFAGPTALGKALGLYCLIVGVGGWIAALALLLSQRSKRQL